MNRYFFVDCTRNHHTITNTKTNLLVFQVTYFTEKSKFEFVLYALLVNGNQAFNLFKLVGFPTGLAALPTTP